VLSAPAAGESSEVTTARAQLVEGDDLRYDRRNRFLDHLIARFAESFNDYVLMLHASKSDLDRQELVEDKIRFLKDYPVSSSRRGTAYDILGEIWNTGNVSGLEKRIARLSGINDPDRRNLFCYPVAEIVNKGTDAAPQFTFVLKDGKGVSYLQPVAPWAFLSEAEKGLNEVYENMLDPGNYFVVEEAGKFKIFLTDSNGRTVATCVRTYDKEESAHKFISSVLKAFAPACDEEGLHLIEHFLLRPRFQPPALPPQLPEDVYRLMKVCLPDDCLFCGEEDPYSFKVTVAMPYWPARFRDPNFRLFFENTIRREAPAHVHVKVCWISFTKMYALENAYRAWLVALQDYRKGQEPDDARAGELRLRSNDLIAILDNLNSVYPEATLHDCVEGTTNPVKLGRTNLGSF
jgi:uncharacterized protein YegP (UPF0339 family)